MVQGGAVAAAMRRNGLIIAEDLEIKENCMPSAVDVNWTKRQEEALQGTLSRIKPGVSFWRLVAERVPGKNAKDCFEKFYSGRTTTRAAKRFRAEAELDFALTERNCSKRVKSISSTSITKTPGRETRATRRASIAPAKIESKTIGNGYTTGALTRQTVATASRGTKRKIEAASNSPEHGGIKASKPESKANGGTLSQRARKGSKQESGKQVLIENRARAPAVGLVSVFDRSSASDGGDESDSASRGSVDADRWTQAQEMALQNAYATIKPSANFWHLISKRVPGRSAEDCFNKFYSTHPTPPRVPQRSYLKEVDCPPSLPRLTKAKTTGGKRLLEAHRTVRNILRKQQVDDVDYKGDAFAALEPPDVVHSVFAMSNETEVKSCVYGPLPGSTKDRTTQCPQSNKENQKPKPEGQSREFGIGQSRVFSPEILKKVRDPLMLDKYIDHLHQRRIRRAGPKSRSKRESARGARPEYELSKDGLDFREVRLDAIRRAKQELRDVFLRPTSVVDDPFLNLLDGSSEGSAKDDEADDDSVNSETVL